MKVVFTILFLVLYVSVIAGANWYLIKQFHNFTPTISKSTWTWIFVSATIFSLIGMMAFSVTDNTLGQIVYCIASILIGLLLYLLLSTFLVQLFNLILPLKPVTKGFSSLITAIIIVIYGIWHSTIPVVKTVEIPVHGLQHPINAVHLTDIHLGHFRGQKHLQRVVDKVKEINPEVIFHTGDLFDARSVLDEDVLKPLSELKAPHFFVEGNHDIHVGITKVTELVKKEGIIILNNEVTSFGELQIVGLKHMLADSESFDMHATSDKETVKSILSNLKIDAEKPAIMLHHSPDGEVYANNKNIDVLLAGHTHGGQMFPLTLISKLLFGYNSGLYQFKNLAIYVSEGIGTMFSPLRVGTNSEITLIKLLPKKINNNDNK